MSTVYCPRPTARCSLSAAGCRLPAAAFTLIEILAVLAIIAIIVAMTIPAVLKSRERARILQCANHQKELGHAAVQFEIDRERFPGYAESVPGYKSGSTTYEAGWPVMLLKTMEREDVWNAFRTGGLADPPKIALFLCPSDIQAGGTGPGLSYAANCGQPDAGEEVSVDDHLGTTHTEYLPDPDDYPPDWAANGIFFRRYTRSGEKLKVETVGAEDIKDGAQHTFLFSEVYGDFVSDAKYRDEPRWSIDVATERQLGFTWSQLEVHGEIVDSKTGKASMGQISEEGPAGINHDAALVAKIGGKDRPLWIPTGYHPGGVNVTYCDGHVVFMSEEVSYKIYSLQMTPNGAQVWEPGKAKGKAGDDGEPPAWCREPLVKP